MEYIADISLFLGGVKVIGRPESERDFVPLIRQGFPAAAFTALRDRTQLTAEVICDSLQIAQRTAARRTQNSARLKPRESELLLRLARVLVQATNVLGSEEKARDWIVAPNRALDGAKPIALLDTGIGFGEVLDILGRIEHGVYS